MAKFSSYCILHVLKAIFLLFQDSLDLQVQELANRDNTIQFNVIRLQGYYGHVSVKWVATGDHDGTNDITPLEGIVSV